MGAVLYLRKGQTHTAPAALVYLTDDSGNVVRATNATSTESNTNESKGTTQ